VYENGQVREDAEGFAKKAQTEPVLKVGRLAGGADIGFKCLHCEIHGMRFNHQILSHLDFGAPQTSNYDVCHPPP
jgi:hypothetical protein